MSSNTRTSNEKYPFWKHELLHRDVMRFYIWLACYNEDSEMIRIFAEENSDHIIAILPVLHIFDQQELMDEINGGDPRLDDVNGILSLHNVDTTDTNTSSLVSLLRSKPSLSHRQYCETKFVDGHVGNPRIPPSKVMLKLVQQLGNEKIDLTYNAGYVFACKNLWSSEIENLDINDAFKSPAHRVAKAMALGLPIPDTIFDTNA